MLGVFRRFGSIQFDPLAVADRNHDLVLRARVADYDPAWCDLLYERREVFEAFNTVSLSFRRGNSRGSTLPSESAPRILAEHAAVAE